MGTKGPVGADWLLQLDEGDFLQLSSFQAGSASQNLTLFTSDTLGALNAPHTLALLFHGVDGEDALDIAGFQVVAVQDELVQGSLFPERR